LRREPSEKERPMTSRDGRVVAAISVLRGASVTTLCRVLLVAHGGEIGLRTERGCTLFWFSVPRQGPDVSRLVQRN
jgi:hypothetical protein